MHTKLTLATLACFAFALLAACGEDAEANVGAECSADADCGSLKCFCVEGEPGSPDGYVPGVCSAECSSQADCDALGSDMSCVKDFCTGFNVCLQGYSGGDTLP